MERKGTVSLPTHRDVAFDRLRVLVADVHAVGAQRLGAELRLAVGLCSVQKVAHHVRLLH
eukprot:354644-Chlamydomonas_euryale.AAC.5